MTPRVFTPEEREALRAELIERARADPRISGGAVTGSGSIGALDAWSDVDLAFGVREAGELPSALDDFTAHMRDRHGSLDEVDVVRDPWIYRVFLLPSTLQVDLAFAPASHFGARAPTFRLVFGDAADNRAPVPPSVRELIGYGWLYALHARSSIARDKPWQAEYMISAMRDQVLALACIRHGLPSREARGIDRLPRDVTAPLESAVVRSLDAPDLVRAFRASADGLRTEIGHVDGALSARLAPVLDALVATAVRT